MSQALTDHSDAARTASRSPPPARSSLSGEGLTDGLRRTPLDQFVVWTGAPLGGEAASRMAHLLRCVTEVGQPVSLRMLAQRAALASEAHDGVSPDELRNGLRQHQASRRVVLILVQGRPSGDFIAVTDIPYGAGSRGPMRRGDIVLAAGSRAPALRTFRPSRPPEVAQ